MLLPGGTVCEDGVAESVKSAVAELVTFKVTFAECETLPLVPVMVRE